MGRPFPLRGRIDISAQDSCDGRQLLSGERCTSFGSGWRVRVVVASAAGYVTFWVAKSAGGDG
jgi:hypothetical protein